MSKIKRYDVIEQVFSEARIEQNDEEGEFCYASDVAALQAENERLRRFVKVVAYWRQDAADMDHDLGYVGAEKTVFADTEQWDAIEEYACAILAKT